MYGNTDICNSLTYCQSLLRRPPTKIYENVRNGTKILKSETVQKLKSMYFSTQNANKIVGVISARSFHVRSGFKRLGKFTDSMYY